jgi:hypothetical protein
VPGPPFTLPPPGKWTSARPAWRPRRRSGTGAAAGRRPGRRCFNAPPAPDTAPADGGTESRQAPWRESAPKTGTGANRRCKPSGRSRDGLARGGCPALPPPDSATSPSCRSCCGGKDDRKLTLTAAAAATRKLYAAPECSGIFVVENMECRQADVRDFLLTESNLLRMLRSLATMTTRRPPTPVWLCPCAFASKLASRATW